MKNQFVKNSYQFFLRKIGKFIIILSLVCVLAFCLAIASPIDPVRAYIGADMLLVSPDQQRIIQERWGLDKPPLIRFGKWFGEIIKGNFGVSMIYNEPVVNVIAKRFYTSLFLMLIAWGLSGIFGFILGIISGFYKNKWFVKIIDIYAYTLASTPVFWLGIVMLVFFSVILQWTPIGGATPPGILPEEATLLQKIHHIILPAATLSVISIANITMHTKVKVIELMQSDFVLYAHSMGESNYNIIRHHILRNALLPAISLQFASIGEIFGGSVLVEQVFSYPGLGKATVEAGIRGDVPLLLGIAIFTTIFVFWGNVVADYFYKVVDPRINQRETVYE